MTGSWSILPIHSEAFAIHAALVHTGKVLYFGGDEYDTINRDKGDYNHTCVFDVATSTVTAVHSPTTDVFCSGQAKLEDGRVLVAGGVSNWGTSGGLREAWIFDPEMRDSEASNPWTQVTSMGALPNNGGRWYPTLLTLPDGRVLAAGGNTSTGAQNTALEAFSPHPAPAGTWTQLGAVNIVPAQSPAYPRMVVMPNGRLFCSSGMGSVTPRTIDTGAGVVIDVVPAPGGYAAFDAGNWRRSAVLLPLVLNAQGKYTTKVLVCDDVNAYKIDLTNGAAGATWTATGARPISMTRLHAEGLLLPTGQVFVCCGVHQMSGNAYHDVMEPELYDPVTDTWSLLPMAEVPRGYHSVSMLLPDGRVWVAGSSGVDLIDGGASNPPAYRKELRIEIFTPDYVTSPSRPVITAAPASFVLGSTFTVRTPNAGAITAVRILRAGATTHGFNSDQRCIELPFTMVDATTLSISAPLDAAVAIPGDYLLFLIGSQNCPSEGRFLRCIADRILVASASKLWRRRRMGAQTGNDWEQAGDAYTVTAMATHQGSLYVASNGGLHRRGRLGPTTANDWTAVGTIPGTPVAMASHLGSLYAVYDEKLWRRGAIGPGTGDTWTLIGNANAVQAMASHQGKLLVVSSGKLWRRNKLDPNTGNDWIEAGALMAPGVTVPTFAAMTSAGGALYAVFNNHLYQRANIDPTTTGESWTNPAWIDLGEAYGVTGMAFYKALWFS